MKLVDFFSGQTPEERTLEAHRILFRIGLKDARLENEKAAAFLRETVARFGKYGMKTAVSVPQLFWLRDLKDKWLDS